MNLGALPSCAYPAKLSHNGVCEPGCRQSGAGESARLTPSSTNPSSTSAWLSSIRITHASRRGGNVIDPDLALLETWERGHTLATKNLNPSCERPEQAYGNAWARASSAKGRGRRRPGTRLTTEGAAIGGFPQAYALDSGVVVQTAQFFCSQAGASTA